MFSWQKTEFIQHSFYYFFTTNIRSLNKYISVSPSTKYSYFAAFFITSTFFLAMTRVEDGDDESAFHRNHYGFLSLLSHFEEDRKYF